MSRKQIVLIEWIVLVLLAAVLVDELDKAVENGLLT